MRHTDLVCSVLTLRVCVCCRPASDPHRCDRGGETVCEPGHRRRRGGPQSAERLLAAVAAQGLKIVSAFLFVIY